PDRPAAIKQVEAWIELPSAPPLFFSFAEQETADQLFQHNGRLSVFDPVALLQILIFGADADTDVLLTQQTGGQNCSRAVHRNGAHGLVDLHFYHGGIPLGVQINFADPADGHASHRYLGAFGQTTQILKAGLHRVGVAVILQRQTTDPERHQYQRNNAQHHKGAHTQFNKTHTHNQTPPSITAVRTKSSPSTAREEITTVWVVALPIPSEVGTES